VWKRQNDFHYVVLRIRAFHTCCAFLAVIGKRFGDFGLRDLLVESGVVRESAVDGFILGKNYNRSLRLHKLLSEALLRFKWQAAESAITLNREDISGDLITLRDQLHVVRSNGDMQNIEQLVKSSGLILFKGAMDKSNEPNDDFGGHTWKWYPSYFIFIRAIREGNWSLHISAVRSMLPWFFAYDRVNYSRYLSSYWWEMIRLPEIHPDAYGNVIQGEFRVSRSCSKSFARVAVDQCIEQNMNRHTKKERRNRWF
jgi:hypothetical protein